MKFFIKKLLLNIYFAIKNISDTITGFWSTAKDFDSIKTVYLIGTPEHDNLGDHAIALAEIQFIKRYFSDYKIVEVTVEQWRKYKINLLLKCKKNDMFFVTGGGNMGNIYHGDEELRRFVIKNFHDNLIIIFPQTVFYTKDKKGEKALNDAKKIYEKHEHLIICAREKCSYEFLKEHFRAEVFLCPDMVFSISNISENKEKTNIVGICLRQDVESALDDNERDKLKHMIMNKYVVEEFNTCHTSNISPQTRELALKCLLDNLSRYRIVITDRLHAVIFSVILNIPCVAISPRSAKISSTINWLPNNKVILLNDMCDFERIISEEFSGKQKFTSENFLPYYEKLAELIKARLLECNIK